MRRSCAVVDGITTSWLEAGAMQDPVLLLLHGGAWGESGGTAWSSVIPQLSGHRVLAPDWLGFGESDKLRDFVDLQGRMITVLAGWLDHLGVKSCTAVGISMGGANLLRANTTGAGLPVRRQVLISAGGAPLTGEARAQLGRYDGSLDSMARQVELSCADPRLAQDGEYLRERHRTSLLPGAFEVMASLGLRSPAASPPPPGDPTPYEQITTPTLIITGGQDQLKPPGYAEDAVRRLPDARCQHFPDAGHCVQLDDPVGVAEAVLTFSNQPEQARTVGAPS